MLIVNGWEFFDINIQHLLNQKRRRNASCKIFVSSAFNVRKPSVCMVLNVRNRWMIRSVLDRRKRQKVSYSFILKSFGMLAFKRSNWFSIFCLKFSKSLQPQKITSYIIVFWFFFYQYSLKVETIFHQSSTSLLHFRFWIRTKLIFNLFCQQTKEDVSLYLLICSK